jgi:hypothetical protein
VAAYPGRLALAAGVDTEDHHCPVGLSPREQAGCSQDSRAASEPLDRTASSFPVPQLRVPYLEACTRHVGRHAVVSNDSQIHLYLLAHLPRRMTLPHAAKPQATHWPPRGPARVLVVLDRPMLVELIKMTLNHGVYNTRAVTTAAKSAPP